jgi:hypothetical protein
LVALVVVSACAFYTRQYYAFLPVFAAWIVLTRTKTSPFLVLSVFFVATLPELYLVYIWKGVQSADTTIHGKHVTSGSNQYLEDRSGSRAAFISDHRRLYPTIVERRAPGMVGGALNRRSLCGPVGFHHAHHDWGQL